MNITKRDEAEQCLTCAMSIGEQLLISGAEVSRVEDTIRRICKAYGASRVDVFSITSSIVTTMYCDGFHPCTQTRRVTGISNDLNRLDELNQLARRVCAEKPTPENIQEDLAKIMKESRYSFPIQVLTYALISDAFSVFFGGDAKDMVSAALIGVLLKCFESFVKRETENTMFTALLCSAAGGFLANLAVRAGLGNHADLISIGNVMLLIPGIAFTNSLRDFFSGDTITGLTRFVESVLLAVIIALGFALPGFLF